MVAFVLTLVALSHRLASSFLANIAAVQLMSALPETRNDRLMAARELLNHATVWQRSASIYRLIGLVDIAVGENDKALRDLSVALLEQPDNEATVADLLRLYDLMDLWNQLRVKHLHVNPTIMAKLDIQTKRAIVYASFGEKFRTAGRLQEARGLFERSLRMNGYLYSSHLGLARVLAAKDAWSESYIEYARAVALNLVDTDEDLLREYSCAWARAWGASRRLGIKVPEWYLVFAKYLRECGRLEDALHEFEAAARAETIPSRLASIYFNYGLTLEKAGLVNQAEKAYLKALEIDEGSIGAFCQLKRLGKEPPGRTSLLVKPGRFSSEFDWPHKEIQGRWTLEGYRFEYGGWDGDPWKDATFLWSTAEPLNSMEQDACRVGEFLARVEKIRNLFPNPGFELDQSVDTGFPFGFSPGDFYGAPADHHVLAIDSRHGKVTKVLRLDNDSEYRHSGLVSLEIPIRPATAYLISGWIKSGWGGRGAIGYVWTGRARKAEYVYIVEGFVEESWTRFSRVIESPSDVRGVRIVLLNYDSVGSVSFDDVFLGEFGSPGFSN